MLRFTFAAPLVPDRSKENRSQLSKIETVTTREIRVDNHSCENDTSKSPKTSPVFKLTEVSDVVRESIIELVVLRVILQIFEQEMIAHRVVGSIVL